MLIKIVQIMSASSSTSKKEQEKTVEAAASAARTIGSQAEQTYNGSLNETKENVRRSIDEAKTQIPRYTDAVKNYQKQTLDSTEDVVENYIEAQQSLVDAVSNSMNPYYENLRRMYSYWISPRIPAEIYTRSVSTIAENISASARIWNDMIFGNLDAFGTALERNQRHTKELSRITVDTAKAIENTARDTAEFSAERQKERRL
jgi:archaellum component FlaC